MILVFDTETTGKADFRAPASSEHQPHLVQLAAMVMDLDGKTRAEINLIIKPDNYLIPSEASDIHGITNEIARASGVPISTALGVFDGLVKTCGAFVAHNFAFDALVLEVQWNRIENCSGKMQICRDQYFCTMEAMTPICKIKGQYGGFKWPKLQEAYKFAFGEEFEGAHDAMADVRACARLYRWIEEMNIL